MSLSNKIPYSRRYDLEHNDIESICIQINYSKSKPIILNFVYRPPDSKQCWIKTFEFLVDQMDALNCELHILGDFNINYNPEKKKCNNNLWNEVMQKYGLTQMVSASTRIGKHSSSIIDHIYTNTSEYIAGVAVPFYSVSDHLPVCFTRATSGQECEKPRDKTITYWCFKKFNVVDFQTDILKAGIDIVETYHDPNDSLQMFYTIINTV